MDDGADGCDLAYFTVPVFGNITLISRITAFLINRKKKSAEYNSLHRLLFSQRIWRITVCPIYTEMLTLTLMDSQDAKHLHSSIVKLGVYQNVYYSHDICNARWNVKKAVIFTTNTK